MVTRAFCVRGHRGQILYLNTNADTSDTWPTRLQWAHVQPVDGTAEAQAEEAVAVAGVHEARARVVGRLEEQGPAAARCLAKVPEEDAADGWGKGGKLRGWVAPPARGGSRRHV